MDPRSEMGPSYIGERSRLKIPRLPQIPRAAFATIVILGIIIVAATACLVYVRPYEFGIKEVKIGVHRGIHSQVYTPGYALVLPLGFEKIHKFPRSILTLELTAFPDAKRKNDAYYFSDKAAKIQTSDGFYVDVDVTIMYKIIDPYKLITTIGPGERYLSDGILPKAEPILKQAFGELTTEDFYNSPLRTDKMHKARDQLNQEMMLKGMQVDHVLIRYFKYSDEIQRNIEEKKLQDQLVFKNQSEARAATESATLKRVAQEGEMTVKVSLEEGEAYKVKRTAEKDLYVRKKTAEADLLVQLAEAKRTELKRAAMETFGADRMVAMKMAEVLRGLETIIVPSGGEGGLNPLDLNEVMALFGSPATPEEKAKPPIPAAAQAPPPPPPAPVAPAASEEVH